MNDRMNHCSKLWNIPKKIDLPNQRFTGSHAGIRALKTAVVSNHTNCYVESYVRRTLKCRRKEHKTLLRFASSKMGVYVLDMRSSDMRMRNVNSLVIN